MAACCPPGSLPFLEATYEAKGTVITVDGGYELYQAPVSGTPSAALLLCPDVWGWNGGRIRAIADGLAGDHGYLVVVAKLLADPALDGGTDGDALPPGGEFSMDWIKNFPWPKQQPKVAAALAYLKSKGCAKIGVFGFCYGGHPACYASSTDEAVVCGVVVHPSMQLETFAFGGDCKALLSSVKCPFLLAPAGNDLPMWGEEGEFGEALKASAKGGECVWKPYPEMTHGWSCRGDVANDKVRRDVEGVMKDASGFFKHYLG